MSPLDNIPLAMRQRKQWMLAGPDKAPRAYDYGTETTYPGAKNNPTQRMSYDEARYLAETHGYYIGFVPLPDDPFTVIDLDWKDNKVYDVEANDFKIGLYTQACSETYVERSVSGKGVHIVVAGKLAHDFNASTAGVECYGNKGFVVMTGRLESYGNEISSQQSWLDFLATKYRRAFEDAAANNGGALNWGFINNPSSHEIALDNALIASMSTWRNSANLERYFYGQDLRPDGGGGSEGDLALMQAFLKFTQSEQKPEAAMRMFLKTPRAKARQPYKTATSNWDQYLGRTLYGAKVRVLADEKRAKDYDMSAGSHAMLADYLAKMNPAAAEPVSASSAPLNMGGMGQRAPINGIEPEAPFMGFKWLSKTDLENQPRLEWAVKGLFPVAGVGAIYGESGAGKSFVAIDLVASIAEGKKWFNLRTKQLPVSVFALEGEGGLKGRVRAWEQVNKRPYPESVYFWDSANNGTFALRDADSRIDYNKKRLIQLCADLIANGRRGGVVVIDTLNQASDGADENSSRDMGELLRAMKFIQRETGSLVLIVHHSTKSKENQSMRGHSSLYGAMDGIMEVLRTVTNDNGDVIENRRGWKAVKVKDGRDGYTKAFDMREVQVDMDEDGPVFSVAIEPVEECIVDEQTGEVAAVSVGHIGGVKGSGAGGTTQPRSRKQAREQREAPPVTRQGAQNALTWNANERTSGAMGGNEPESAMGWNGMRPQDAVRQAIMYSSSESRSTGKFGGAMAHCAPRNDALERAIVLRNYPNPSVGKRDLNRAIDAMIASGKLGSQMESGKIQWVWIVENNS